MRMFLHGALHPGNITDNVACVHPMQRTNLESLITAVHEPDVACDCEVEDGNRPLANLECVDGADEHIMHVPPRMCVLERP